MSKPETFSINLTYDEKLELLSFLIDMIHDQDEFRSFLNKRIDDKAVYNKQKLDIHLEIKSLENSKQEIIKEHAQTDYANNNEERLKEIEELKTKLANATRTESRRINDRI